MDVNNVLLCLPFKTTTFVIVLINKKIEIISIYWMLDKNPITNKNMLSYADIVISEDRTKQANAKANAEAKAKANAEADVALNKIIDAAIANKDAVARSRSTSPAKSSVDNLNKEEEEEYLDEQVEANQPKLTAYDAELRIKTNKAIKVLCVASPNIAARFGNPDVTNPDNYKLVGKLINTMLSPDDKPFHGLLKVLIEGGTIFINTDGTTSESDPKVPGDGDDHGAVGYVKKVAANNRNRDSKKLSIFIFCAIDDGRYSKTKDTPKCTEAMKNANIDVKYTSMPKLRTIFENGAPNDSVVIHISPGNKEYFEFVSTSAIVYGQGDNLKSVNLMNAPLETDVDGRQHFVISDNNATVEYKGTTTEQTAVKFNINELEQVSELAVSYFAPMVQKLGVARLATMPPSFLLVRLFSTMGNNTNSMLQMQYGLPIIDRSKHDLLNQISTDTVKLSVVELNLIFASSRLELREECQKLIEQYRKASNSLPEESEETEENVKLLTQIWDIVFAAIVAQYPDSRMLYDLFVAPVRNPDIPYLHEDTLALHGNTMAAYMVYIFTCVICKEAYGKNAPKYLRERIFGGDTKITFLDLVKEDGPFSDAAVTGATSPQYDLVAILKHVLNELLGEDANILFPPGDPSGWRANNILIAALDLLACYNSNMILLNDSA